MFGVTPCPTVIFTFGVLLLAKPRLPFWLFVIPAVWAVIGGSAAILLDVREDWMLFGALTGWIAIEATRYLSARHRHLPKNPN